MLFSIRLIIAIVIGIPTAPFFIYAVSIFGVGFILLPAGLCMVAFFGLLNNKEGVSEGLDALIAAGLLAPARKAQILEPQVIT